MHRLLIVLTALLLAGCGASGASQTASNASSADPTAGSSPSDEPTRAVDPSATPASIEDTIVGTVGFDDIEGGCTYLQTADGTRYEVVWPEGWSLDPELNVIDPSGAIVAGVGDELTIGGRIAGDLASICQIGPIFEAVEVTAGG